MGKFIDLTNSIFTSKRFGDIIVTKYVNSTTVHIKFINTGWESVVTLSSARKGCVQDNLAKTCYGVGHIGDTKTSFYANHKPSYSLWKDMLKRCYDSDYQSKRKSYKGCSVSETFLCYSDFEKWCNEQIGFGVYGFRLDKYILFKGNKIYSEDTCCFVPVELNGLLIRQESCRGEYPIGVSINKSTGKFKARIAYSCIGKHLGIYDTPEEAFLAYKQAKEDHIKVLADKWKDKIDPRAYEALMNYQVEITD